MGLYAPEIRIEANDAETKPETAERLPEEVAVHVKEKEDAGREHPEEEKEHEAHHLPISVALLRWARLGLIRRRLVILNRRCRIQVSKPIIPIMRHTGSIRAIGFARCRGGARRV